MATSPTLLSLATEIRFLIYSYMLPKVVNMDIVRDDMDGPLRNTLFLVCRLIHREALEYYYSTNTFLLDLSEPSYAPNRFVNGTKSLLKYIRRVQNLQLVIGDSFPVDEDPYALSEYAREQVDWFLTTLREANENHQGPWLKNLVVQDNCQPSILTEFTREVLEKGKKRREILISLLVPFGSRIRANLSIESRALSQIRIYDGSRDANIAPAWDTVVGVSQMHSGIPLPAASGPESSRIPRGLTKLPLPSSQRVRDFAKDVPGRHRTLAVSIDALHFTSQVDVYFERDGYRMAHLRGEDSQSVFCHGLCGSSGL